MGTKARIAPEVARIILSHNPATVVDPFCGMGAVAAALATTSNVVLADALHFVAHIARVRFTQEAVAARDAVEPLKGHFDDHLQFLRNRFVYDYPAKLADRINATPRVSNDEATRATARTLRHEGGADRYQLATLYYANTYFSLDQCVEIDALRYAIDAHADDGVQDVLLSCFLVALSKCVNSTGHTAQYLRAGSGASAARVAAKWSRSIWDYFVAAVEGFQPVGDASWRSENQVLCGDAIEILKGLSDRSHGVVYMDPPYTRDHYSRYYHVYEELFLYRFPEVSGVGIYPTDRFTSVYSIKSQAVNAYQNLFAEAARVADGMVLSFPENTFLGKTEEVLLPLLDANHVVRSIQRLPHSHSSLGGTPGFASTAVVELLIDCEATAR
jgi:adenine-specific DNA-methyltransferase